MRRIIAPLLFAVLVTLATVLPPVYANANNDAGSAVKNCLLEE